jgi:prepilin-type N-terminal cleavage/methylation domain-containing protein
MRRRGFTLIEILIVVTILLVLTFVIITAFRGNEGQKVRDGGRSVQSTILGARDRALHARKLRGFRIMRDASDTNIGTGFAYIQPLDLLEYGPNAIQLERIDVDGTPGPDGNEVLIVRGAPGNDWSTLTEFFPSVPRIRIPSKTGEWYQFQVLTTGPYALTAANPVLRLVRPFVDASGNPGNNIAFNFSSAYSSADLDVGYELLPNVAPMALPSGVVIDLANSSPAARGDILFSPRGMIAGTTAAGGPIYFLLRDIRDVVEGVNPADNTVAIQRDQMIVALFPQTGHVQIYPVDRTDVDGNNVADDLFRFAKLGSAAGG